jgi:hypothetical protein
MSTWMMARGLLTGGLSMMEENELPEVLLKKADVLSEWGRFKRNKPAHAPK